MLALLLGAGILAVVLLLGLALAVAYAGSSPDAAVHGTHLGTHAGTTAPSDGGTSGPRRTGASDPRETLARKAMPEVGEDASHPGPVSAIDPGTPIALPAASGTGSAQVPTGFPHTPAGAMAQLAAIDQVALQSGSLAGVRAVIGGWAMPGGPDGSSWSVVRGLAGMLAQAGLSGGGSSQLAIVLTPLMGLVKGSVGPDFVIPCVDFELDVTLQQTARGATADCQRMVWQPAIATQTGAIARAGGRWLIGAGAEPSTPASVWPDTDVAIAVGYRDLQQEH